MPNIRYAFFPFSPLDYRAAQVWLNKQGQAGWRLERLGAYFARLEQGDMLLRYGIALFKRGSLFDEDTAAFKAFCADAAQAGWTYTADSGCMRVFCAENEKAPLLDPETEAMQFNRNYVRPLLWSMIFLIALCVLFCILFFTQAFALLTGGNIMPLCVYVLLPLCCLVACIEWFRAYRRGRSMAAMQAGLPLRTPNEAACRRHGVCRCVLTVCLFAGLLLCAASDIYTDKHYISSTAYFLAIPLLSLSLGGFRRMPKRRTLSWAGVLLSAALLFLSASFRNQYNTDIPQDALPLPVLTDTRRKIEYNRLQTTRNLFYRGYAYGESGAALSYSQSWCYDAAAPFLADRLYASACRPSYARGPLLAEPLKLPGAERAALDADRRHLVFQQGNRVGKILMLGSVPVDDPAVLALIQARFLRGES